MMLPHASHASHASHNSHDSRPTTHEIKRHHAQIKRLRTKDRTLKYSIRGLLVLSCVSLAAAPTLAILTSSIVAPSIAQVIAVASFLWLLDLRQERIAAIRKLKFHRSKIPIPTMHPMHPMLPNFFTQHTNQN